jgi:prepilin-type N-terminal cleavage/methylation domain-containing protein
MKRTSPGRLLRSTSRARRVFGRLRENDGLSLVELVVAMLVLAIGLLGMAAGTGWMIRAVDLAQLETARGAALQAAVEAVRGTEWNDLEDGQDTFGNYTVQWTTVAATWEGRHFRFVIVGPGRGATGSQGMPHISQDATMTLDYRVSRR